MFLSDWARMYAHHFTEKAVAFLIVRLRVPTDLCPGSGLLLFPVSLLPPRRMKERFITSLQNAIRTNWCRQALRQVVKGVQIRKREDSCLLLPEPCFLQPFQEAGPKNNLKSGPRLVVGWECFCNRNWSLFDLQTWALETVSGLLAGR